MTGKMTAFMGLFALLLGVANQGMGAGILPPLNAQQKQQALDLIHAQFFNQILGVAILFNYTDKPSLPDDLTKKYFQQRSILQASVKSKQCGIRNGQSASYVEDDSLVGSDCPINFTMLGMWNPKYPHISYQEHYQAFDEAFALANDVDEYLFSANWEGIGSNQWLISGSGKYALGAIWARCA